ncbi:MAG: hypothetical protein K0R84_2344 [Clostridia bacterium]|nr:hypothetical protein [Clostridia bacterium]
MRKLIAIFIICSTILYGIMLCYADEQGSGLKDLPLASRYETKQALEELNDFTAEAESILAEQKVNLDTLGSLYYLGYDYKSSFDGSSLEDSMNWNGYFEADSPIYKSEIYKGYYKLRTEKPLLRYRNSLSFDYEAFIKPARQEFDSYIRSAVKSEADRTKLVVLLQEKLTDKLPELETAERKAALDEIYSLRLPENAALCNDYIYQVFESRVRTEVLMQMLEINKASLGEFASDIAINISAQTKGSLLIKYKNTDGTEAVVQILNTAKDDSSYCGFTVLYELFGKKDSSLVFVDGSGQEHIIEMSRALKAISLDDRRYLQLELDGLLELKEDAVKNPDNTEQTGDKDLKQDEEQLKEFETLHSRKAAEAQVIIKELNRYSIYLELKSKNIQNSFTRSFEAQNKLWKAAVEARLKSFGPGGMADFASYIKQFVLLSRSELGQTERGRIITARFRNSVVQFRQPDESSLWITDMLYSLKYMKP